jgi:hypothetical protein
MPVTMMHKPRRHKKKKRKEAKAEPDAVHLVNLEGFTQVGNFFVQPADPTSLFYADPDTMFVLLFCANSGLFDTQEQMDYFHQQRCSTRKPTVPASTKKRKASGADDTRPSARDRNWLITNSCKSAPVLVVEPGGAVGNLHTLSESETKRFKKGKLDEFNRNEDQVAYRAGPTDPKTGLTPVFAAGVCQVNSVQFWKKLNLDPVCHKRRKKRKKRKKVKPKKTGSSNKAVVAVKDRARTSSSQKPRKRRRRALTESARFVPVLRCKPGGPRRVICFGD